MFEKSSVHALFIFNSDSFGGYVVILHPGLFPELAVEGRLFRGLNFIRISLVRISRLVYKLRV